MKFNRWGCLPVDLPKVLLAFLGICVLGTSQSVTGQILDIREESGFPPEVRTIYEKGVAYLVKTQQKDGSWTNGQGGNVHGTEANGVTALAVMAFLSTGEDPNFGRYSVNIRKALRSIIRAQNARTGYIPGNMYVHGFSMLALSEAYGVVDEEMLWEGTKEEKGKRSIGQALELAVRLAVDSQKRNPYGGWRYSPNDKSADTSVVGAVLMGLLAAKNAGMKVPDQTIEKALGYMKQMTSDSSGSVGYSGLGGFGDSNARSAIACLVFSIGKRKKWKEFEATKNYVAKGSPLAGMAQSWPFYTRYYQSQALFQADYESWKKWNRKTIREIRKQQLPTGQIGSSNHGPAYSTAMSLLALALNYKFLPIYER